MLSKRPDNLPAGKKPSRIVRIVIQAERQLSRASWTIARIYERADNASGGLVSYLYKGWLNFSQHDMRYAASLAYYAFFSIFPLILLAITLLSGLIGSSPPEDILKYFETFFPADTVGIIEDNVLLALRQRQSFSIVAIVGLAWSGLSLFSNLTVAIDTIFHPTRMRSLWHKRALALIMVIVLAALLAVSLFTSVVTWLVSIPVRDNTTLHIITLFLPLGLNMTIFALMFRHVPRVFVRWDAIWPAAALGGMGWEVAKRLFVWYLDNFGNYSVIYGSLGTVIVLLLWIYLSAVILMISAELCNALNSWFTDRASEEQQPPLEPSP